VLCTPQSAYEPAVGNPAGSIAAKTTITLNLVDLFKGTEIWNSPQFTVPADSAIGASIHLDRAFDAGGLIEVAPKGTYTVTLRDLTAGSNATPLTEEVSKEDATFATRSAPASVVGGHTYQISIEATTAQSVLAVSLLSGMTALRFDNVGLPVQTPGGEGSGGSITDAQLSSLVQSSLISPAVVKGKRMFVKAKCPAKVASACKIGILGLLKKGKPATSSRSAKVGKGKTKKFVLQVKPKAMTKVAGKKRLLFKETVKAGGAKATVYKHLKLIRRG
jgi:hypothetical protein